MIKLYIYIGTPKRLIAPNSQQKRISSNFAQGFAIPWKHWVIKIRRLMPHEPNRKKMIRPIQIQIKNSHLFWYKKKQISLALVRKSLVGHCRKVSFCPRCWLSKLIHRAGLLVRECRERASPSHLLEFHIMDIPDFLSSDDKPLGTSGKRIFFASARVYIVERRPPLFSCGIHSELMNW